VEARAMRWLKRNLWKVGIAIAGMLLLLTLLMIVIALAGGGRQSTLPSQASGTAAIQVTPTVDATAVVQDQLKQQDEKLQRENSFPWTILNTSSVGTILLGIAGFASAVIGFSQWRGNRRDEQKKREEEQDRWRKEREEERRKRDEGRFQAVVEGLGSKDIEARVGSAVALRTFLQPGYEQFYKQVFDLACAYLLLRKAAPNTDLNVPISLDPLSGSANNCMPVEARKW
jgi:multidrug efflux pump subunit AcrB